MPRLYYATSALGILFHLARGRHPCLRESERRSHDLHNPLGLGIRQRLEENRVGHREERRVRADPERQCEHG
jgi:hypothetical protein